MEEKAEISSNDVQWDSLFSRSIAQLAQLAVCALQDYQAQKTQTVDDLIGGCDNKIFERE
jgi:hypothetical protein